MPLDIVGEAAPHVVLEPGQRRLEGVPIVKRKGGIVPAPGLLDQPLERRSPPVAQRRGADEPQPRRILDPAVNVAELQQPRLLLGKTGKIPAPDTARVLPGSRV